MAGRENGTLDPATVLRLVDGDLSPTELAELNATLAADPAARKACVELGLHAVGLSESLSNEAFPAAESRPRYTALVPWLLVACSLLVVWVAVPWGAPSRPLGTVANVRGECWTASTLERQCEAGSPVYSGDTVRTNGPDSGATVVFSDGTEIVLSGDTAVAFADDGTKCIRVHRGDLSAKVAPQPSSRPLRFETADAVIEVLGTTLSVSCPGSSTAVGVASGEVRVTDRARNESVTVRAGETATVSPSRPVAPVPRTLPAPTWTVDFASGLPRKWETGSPVTVDGRSGVRAEPVWLKQHGREHFQVVSQNAWWYGLFAFDVESGHLTVDLRLERAGPVQAIFVVRDDPPGTRSPAQLYFHDDIASGVPAGEWRTVRVPLKDFRKRFDIAPHAKPTAFTAIFDSLDRDLGLVVGRVRAGAD